MVRTPSSWLEVLDALYEGSWSTELRRFRSPYAFRGFPAAHDDLTTGLQRLAPGHGDVARLERALVRNFRKYAHGQVTGMDSIWHWLALGQHHGLPTRFLDWTYSPLVALHFATAPVGGLAEAAVVRCVNFVAANRLLPARLRRILEQEASDTLTAEMLAPVGTLRAFDGLARRPFLVFLEPPALDARILNQSALLSLMSSPTARSTTGSGAIPGCGAPWSSPRGSNGKSVTSSTRPT